MADRPDSQAPDAGVRPGFPGAAWHDMGGAAAGGIDRAEHDFELWEKRVDAMLTLLVRRGVFRVDALRRALEDLGEEAFESMTYYERWVAAIARLLVEAGVLTPEEIRRRVEEVRRRGGGYGEASAGAVQ